MSETRYIVACPKCGTRFDVTTYAKAGQTKLRCGRCIHVIDLTKVVAEASK